MISNLIIFRIIHRKLKPEIFRFIIIFIIFA